MADELRPTKDWCHNRDHLGLGQERRQGPERMGYWELMIRNCPSLSLPPTYSYRVTRRASFRGM